MNEKRGSLKALLGLAPRDSLIVHAAVYVLLLAGVTLFLIPLAWTVSTALKANAQVFAIPPIWIPKPVVFENFIRAWTELPFSLFLRNTVVITLISLVGTLLSASLVAYGFTRMQFPGKRILFMILLSTMMLPSQVTMIPVYRIWMALGLLDTYWPLCLGSWLGGGAFSIFLLRQFFLTIPKEYFEAATIDGCSPIQVWAHIYLPLSRPSMITIGILSFFATWNEFMAPLIYLNSMEKYPVTIGLRMFQDLYGAEVNLLMAASLVHILPCIVLFFAAQRYFVKGMVLTGLK